MSTTLHACVARHEQPLFPFNAFWPLQFPAPSLPVQPVAKHANPSAAHHDPLNAADDEDQDDDDESGGVPLPPSSYWDDAAVATAASSVQMPIRLAPPSAGLFGTTRGDHVKSRLHPRPESLDISEEEDGRRVRFTLDGEPDQGFARFDVCAANTHHLQNTHIPSNYSRASISVTTSSPTIHAVDAQLNAQAPSPPDRPPQLPVASPQLHQYRNVVLRDERREDETDSGDLENLAVDNPLHLYDFADFTETWRLRSISDTYFPEFRPQVRSAAGLDGSNEMVSRDQFVSENVDMQGLRWPLVCPSRNHAIAARAFLHPSRLGTGKYPRGSPSLSTDDRHQEERHYRFRSFIPRRRAKIEHYQLRNLLAAGNRNEIFYPTGNQVMRTSLACPSAKVSFMNLAKPLHNCSSEFRITCLSTTPQTHFPAYRTDKVLVAGGFHGEYALLSLGGGDNAPVKGFVTHASNGIVTHAHSFPDRRSGLPQLAFTSNDARVRIMDVRSQTFTHTFAYQDAVNCSSTSPDGRLRVLAGDTTEVLITDSERGHPVMTLQDHSDHGFACDWSHDGRYVASADQDGKTVVWDARNWSRPLRSLHSALSCVRSLKFADGGELVVAESEDVVRVYDSGCYEEYQEIRFFGSIAGVTLLDGGDELVVANVDKTIGGLLSFERSSPRRGHVHFDEQTWPADGCGSFLRPRRRTRLGAVDFMI